MIWDHVFGTFVYDPARPARDFGIDEPIPLSWLQQQWLPLTHIARDVRDSRIVRALTGRADVKRVPGT